MTPHNTDFSVSIDELIIKHGISHLIQIGWCDYDHIGPSEFRFCQVAGLVAKLNQLKVYYYLPNLKDSKWVIVHDKDYEKLKHLFNSKNGFRTVKKFKNQK